MKNYVQFGNTVTLAAPYAVSSGDGALVGSIFGVAEVDLANGVEGEFKVKGVFDLTTLSTDTGSVGAKMYWDNAAKRLTTTATANTLVGALLKAKLTAETTSRVRLNGTVV